LIALRWRLTHSRMKKLPGDVRFESEEDWWKPRMNVRAFGMEVPVFAVLGGIGTFLAWLAVMGLYTATLIVGSIWMAVGVTGYVLYRRSRGLPLTETREIEMPPIVGVEPIQYADVLVAFEDGTYSETAMATALKLASHKQGDVRVIATVTVPRHLELQAPLPEADATARAVIETARQWAGRRQRVRGTVAHVRPGEAGHRIVREAGEARSDVIVMPMPARRPSGKVLNRTLEVVLGKRPCRVIVDSAPAEPLIGKSREAAGIT
jgi:APA family basic amino acid/polyamine antiporter